MANIVIAYICWFFFGPLGLHHFYLGRDKHAFVWWMSGGGFVLGWLRDLWRLPEYVYEANQDERFLRELEFKRANWKQPKFNVARFAGELLIGSQLAYVFRLAVPELSIVCVVLPVVGTTVGVYLVATIGNETVDRNKVLLGACVGIPWLLPVKQYIIASPIFATIFATHFRQWGPNRVPTRGKFIARASTLTACGVIYLLLLGKAIDNISLANSDRTSDPVLEALNSPSLKEMKEATWYYYYYYCQHYGWCDKRSQSIIDPPGEQHYLDVSFDVLGFEVYERPTPEAIESRCRQLVRKWQPGQFQTEDEIYKAQEKLINVLRACDIIEQYRKKRIKSRDSKKPGHGRTEF